MSKTAKAIVTITNRLGLHARPAMTFAEAASAFDCQITVRRPDQDMDVDGKSIMMLMMLAATRGTEIEIVASGDNAEAALESLVDLVRRGFDED